MLIVGTGGLASDLLSAIEVDDKKYDLCFYNDTIFPAKDYITARYRVIDNFDGAKKYFESEDRAFVLAVGDNTVREALTKKFEAIGGVNVNFISSKALVGNHVQLGKKGVIVLHYSVVGNECVLGEGTLIYVGVNMGHGCTIGKYALISGNVCMSDVEIGGYTFVGIGASFKPGVKVGHKCFVSVGCVVTKDIPDGYLVAGNPGRAIKKIIEDV
jgi:sugar O-acyltransferase (sialic acid O-acetyltransferase NeuD family)